MGRDLPGRFECGCGPASGRAAAAEARFATLLLVATGATGLGRAAVGGFCDEGKMRADGILGGLAGEGIPITDGTGARGFSMNGGEGLAGDAMGGTRASDDVDDESFTDETAGGCASNDIANGEI